MKSRKIYLLILPILFMLSGLSSISAQCDRSAVIDAQEFYERGQFDKVMNLKSCALSEDYANDETEIQVEALTILTYTYIALDSTKDARITLAKIIKLDRNFKPEPEASSYFKELFEGIKKEVESKIVSSASKTGEDPQLAPATMIVVTEEDIKNRGYMDLEQLLHDLPGFDISRSNGMIYSSIYMRGYNSDGNDKMLLTIDGVEENNLWGGTMYLSRQYPLSNIKSVEVIYGPLSTIYGPNSFLGVINITTKRPKEFINHKNNMGIAFEAGYGSWGTRYFDGTIAKTFPKQDIDLSITYRKFSSDEPNFGEQDHWQDYKPWSLDESLNYLPYNYTVRDLYRDRLSITDSSEAAVFINDNQGNINSDYFRTDTLNGILHVVPTEVGIKQALSIDNIGIANKTGGQYLDYTSTNMILMRFRLKNIFAGFHYWKKVEGGGLLFSDVQNTNSNRWSPKSLAAFLKYEQQFNKKILFTSFFRYKLQSYDSSNSSISSINAYRNKLNLTDLLNEIPFTDTTSYFDQRSNQVRLENSITYIPNKFQTAILGLENRLSTIQDNYYISFYPFPDHSLDLDVKHYFLNDIGVYGQLSQSMEQFSKRLKYLKGIIGFRWDGNLVFGESEITPSPSFRSMLLYTPKNYIFKFIYSSAFKAPTNEDLYSMYGSPIFESEKVNNFELSIRRFFNKNHRSSIQLTSFNSRYTSLLRSGSRNITGLEATIDYHYKYENHKFYFSGNYSFILPLFYYYSYSYDNFLISDMSRHKFNIGVNYNYNKIFNANLRINFLGKRKTGVNTTVRYNINDFGPTAILHGAITYQLIKYGLDIQLVANNILDTRYFTPGIQAADGANFSVRLPQNPRGIHLKVRYNTSFKSKDVAPSKLKNLLKK